MLSPTFVEFALPMFPARVTNEVVSSHSFKDSVLIVLIDKISDRMRPDLRMW